MSGDATSHQDLLKCLRASHTAYSRIGELRAIMNEAADLIEALSARSETATTEKWPWAQKVWDIMEDVQGLDSHDLVMRVLEMIRQRDSFKASLEITRAAPSATATSECVWVRDTDGCYATGCGHHLAYEETLKDCGVEFCQCCGGKMREVK